MKGAPSGYVYMYVSCTVMTTNDLDDVVMVRVDAQVAGNLH